MGSIIIIYVRSLETIRPVVAPSLHIYVQDSNVYVEIEVFHMFLSVFCRLLYFMCLCIKHNFFCCFFFFPSSVLFYSIGYL